MKRIMLFQLITTVFYISVLYAQLPPPPRFVIPSNLTKVGATSWAVGGGSAAAEGNPAAILINPSALKTDRTAMHFEISRRFISIDNLYQDFNWDKHNVLPSLVVINRPFSISNFSIGYTSYVNLSKIFHAIFPDNEPIEIKQGFDIHTVLVGGNRSFNDIVSFGITFGLNYLSHQYQYNDAKDDGKGVGFQLIVGSLFVPLRNLTVGTVIRSANDIDYELGEEKEFVIREDPFDQDSRIIARHLIKPPMLSTKFPWTIEIGLNYSLEHKLDLHAQFSFQRWSRVTEEFEDQLQIHTGIKMLIQKYFSFNLGFFTENDPASYLDTYYDQKFLTAGFTLRLLGDVSLSSALADNHFFDNQFHQTYASLGLSVMR